MKLIITNVLWWFILFFTCPILLLSQNSKEYAQSLEKELIKLSEKFEFGDYNQAIIISDSLLSSITKENDSWARIKCLKGKSLTNLRQISLAEEELANAHDYWILNKDTLNPYYARLQIAIGEVNIVKGKLEIAIFYTKSSKEILERIDYTNHKLYASALNNLGYLYHVLEQYEPAEYLYRNALLVLKKTLGDKHPYYATATNSLGFLMKQMGNYDEAEKLLIKSKNLRQEILGKNHAEYSTSLNSLGSFYQNIGEFKKAELYYQEAIGIRRNLANSENYAYSLSSALNNLAFLYVKMRNVDNAKLLHQEALQIRDSLLGKKHLDYSNSLLNLAEIDLIERDFESAKKRLEEVEGIRHENLGTNTPSYANVLARFADLYRGQKKFNQSKIYIEDAIKIRKENLGENHSSYINSLIYIGELYHFLNNNKEAEKHLTHFFQKKRKWVQNFFTILSETEKEKLITSDLINFHNRLLAIGSEVGTPTLNELLFDLSIFIKGLQLNSSIKTKTFVLQSSDSETLKDYYELLGLKRKLRKQIQRPLRKRKSVESLNQNIDQLEKKLSRASGFFETENNYLSTNASSIKESLSSYEAACEFITYQEIDDNEIYYAAIILIPQLNGAYLISLGKENNIKKSFTPLNKDSNNSLSQIYSFRGIVPKKQKLSKQIYNLVWQPIDSLLQAENIKTVYYSPAGLLHRLNLSALPIDSTQMLGDKYKMVQLSSTRLLALDREETNSENTAYIVGGVDYNYKDFSHPFINNFHQAVYTWLEQQPNSLRQNSSLADTDNTSEDYFSYVDRSLRGDTWTYLPGTKEETKAITTLLKKKAFKINYQSGVDATEANFKQLGTTSKSPKIIHLATHGFFFPDPVDSLKNNTREPVFKISEHPMLRSGLLLAGANRVWGGEASFANKEDGILTAYEISNMNLTNTELVVLSACETGLGDIQGSEGVYGLQRAFKKAGVRYLIMSLWQVPDMETSLFMQTFYQNYLDKGLSINDAFDATQKAMRAQFDDPYLWAGFVLME